MKANPPAIALVLLLVSGIGAAQEPELINEIVARVNGDIITRNDYLVALQEFKNELGSQLRQSGKGEADVEAEFQRLKPTVLDYLIDDLLLEQKAKELGVDVEAEINLELLEVAKRNNIPNVLELEKVFRQQGMEPEQVRQTLRKRLLQQHTINREVMAPIFQNLTEKDLRDFYEKNKEHLTIPGEISLSEIFLPLEGHTADEIGQRARRLVAELRAGQDFATAVRTHSPASRASRAQNGNLGTLKPDDLNPDIAAAIKDLEPGQITEPIRLQDGYQIIRVDARKPAQLRPFEDAEVQNMLRRAATMEKAEEDRKKYVQRLRDEAFIRISEGYESAKAQVKADNNE